MSEPTRITAYRVDTWLNQLTNEPLYGVSVRIVGVKKWARVCDGKNVILRDTKREIEAYIERMKFERDENGEKLPPMALQAKESIAAREYAASQH
ncbi:MAG: hypothetical protein KGL39_20105 [Patescibacteria group bacterium]|nr:hypothetical protein [Patescibacteria group bacterium]